MESETLAINLRFKIQVLLTSWKQTSTFQLALKIPLNRSVLNLYKYMGWAEFEVRQVVELDDVRERRLL